MARVVPRALIALLGVATCLAVVGAALLVSDSREAEPERIQIDLAAPVADALATAPQLDAVDVGRRTEATRGFDEAAYARARERREGKTNPPPRDATSDWRGGRLDVRVVRDEDGAPVPHAELRLTLTNVESTTIASRTTDDSGGASFEGLPADIWKVNVTVAGCLGRSARHIIDPTKPTGSIEIRMACHRMIAVRIVDDAGNERSAVDLARTFGDRQRVEVAGLRSCAPVGSSLEPGNQRYNAARGISPGSDAWRLTLRGVDAHCAVALLGDTILGCTPIDPGVQAIDVRIGDDVIRDMLAPLPVLVVGEVDNLPIAGALVRFGETPGGVVEARSDFGGRALVDAPLPGGTPYSVSAEGFATARGKLARKLGGQLLVRLAPGRRIQGFLRDENDRPLVRATVALHEADESGARLERGSPTLVRSGPDGAFAFDGLEARSYAVGGRGDLRTESGAIDRPADFVFVDCREKDGMDVVVRRIAVPRPATSVRGPR